MLLYGKWALLCACMRHKKHLHALLAKMLIAKAAGTTFSPVVLQDMQWCWHALSMFCPAAGYASFFLLSAGLGPLSLRVLCQMALRQHFIGCCIAIRQELTHRQEAIVKNHTGLTLWYLGSLVSYLASHEVDAKRRSPFFSLTLW